MPERILPVLSAELRAPAVAHAGDPDELLAARQAALERLPDRGDTFAPVLSLSQERPL
jgi:hypothetical protein